MKKLVIVVVLSLLSACSNQLADFTVFLREEDSNTSFDNLTVPTGTTVLAAAYMDFEGEQYDRTTDSEWTISDSSVAEFEEGSSRRIRTLRPGTVSVCAVDEVADIPFDDCATPAVH